MHLKVSFINRLNKSERYLGKILYLRLKSLKLLRLENSFWKIRAKETIINIDYIYFYVSGVLNSFGFIYLFLPKKALTRRKFVSIEVLLYFRHG